jgi:hypothetical protein
VTQNTAASLFLLAALVLGLTNEVTFLRMRTAESSLADTEQERFEKTYGIANHNCERPFLFGERVCNGIYGVKAEGTEAPVVYACSSSRCRFECPQ